MIKLSNAQRLGFKKILFNKGKSLFVVIPIAIMFGIIVFASSVAANLIIIAHNNIFSPIQSQNEVIELNKSSSQSFRDALSGTSDTGYTTTDNAIISQISNVDSVNLISTLPIQNIKSTDLFDGKAVTISSLAGLDANYASLYTDKNFSYTDNSLIPIILNANDFSYSYEDWSDNNEINIDFTKAADPSQIDSLSSQSPIKSKAIQYNRADLIGKKITITFGGLSSIADIKQESTSTGIKYTKKTQTEIDLDSAARKTAISKYWDYSKISTPLTYNFVVVGISEGSDKTKAFIPTTFATKLMSDYVNNELAARNSTTMASSEYNSTYIGLVYDGVTLQNDTNSTIFAGIRNQVNNQVTDQFNKINTEINNQNSIINSNNSQIRKYNTSINQQPAPGDHINFTRPTFRAFSSISNLSTSSISISYPGTATTYTIPGLIYEKNRTTNEITGEYKKFDLTQVLPLPSNTILIKINNTTNREQVVTDLNSKGYNYQDYSQYKQYQQLESYLGVILEIGSIVFIVITGLLILINMAKFVSESRREIGIFRAIGATKGDIRLIVTIQTILYILLSILIGAIIGIVINFSLSSVLATSAQQLITSAMGSSVVLSHIISASDFFGLNYQLILIYTLGLIAITLIVSLIPSNQAAKISPVEAIRNS